ncbi:hypothetical protein LBUL_1370 [Lactobacillus delbrueckii subsp. bulgaricus ATCC BAA-365]|nr:hypothetical protein LBUL_1370 [Lactobacillus delbrueckii subsp. bulgaricus ATCC BAA-365]CDR73202.1 Protein of unknown function [Lactobacillus delbrueckii subsp. bulgaricus]CDR75297.1 Protein of unknown function [Lactobacillus delbrueckii subsp. bulgaricus]
MRKLPEELKAILAEVD